MDKAKGSFFRSSMVNIYMNAVKSGLFTTRTVDELLWGYEDPLLARISAASPGVEKDFGLMHKVCVGLSSSIRWAFSIFIMNHRKKKKL